jgi:hypothetical protein
MALLLVFLIDYRYSAAATSVSYLLVCNNLEKLMSFVYFPSPVRRTHILPA